MRKLLPCVLLVLCIFCSTIIPAASQTTATITVTETDSEVTATCSGYISSQGGGCSIYFRCKQDGTAVHTSTLPGDHTYQIIRIKGGLSAGQHLFEVETRPADCSTASDSDSIYTDNTPQMSVDPIDDTTQPFNITGTASFVDNGVNKEGTLYLYSRRAGDYEDFGDYEDQQGTSLNWAWTSNFSGSYGSPVYPGNLTQGQHRIEYWARAYNGQESTKQNVYYQIDNTPQLTISPIEQVEGVYDVTGAVVPKIWTVC